MDIYVLASATRYENTACIYCPPDDEVTRGGVTTSIGTCLSDEFSAAWMEDADEVGKKRIFNEQF